MMLTSRSLAGAACAGLAATALWTLPVRAQEQAAPQAQAQPPAQAEDPRSKKILGNLKLSLPQLAEMQPSMGEIKPTEIEGLHQGTFNVQGRPYNFLVTADDSKLWLLQGEAMDVSRSEEAIAVELAKREEEKKKEAAERKEKLAKATEGVPVRGAKDGVVTIVEFSDFQCPYCSRGANTVEEILAKYPNDVKFVFKHFPLNFHPWAKPAAIASNCAANQNDDAFWTLHDKYFEHQKELTPENVAAKSEEYLKGSNIDMAQWKKCATDTNSEEYKAESQAVDADMAFGQSMGVSGTPGFFVNGEFLNGAQPLAAFEPLIEKAKSGS